MALALGGAIIIGSIESFLYYRSFTRTTQTAVSKVKGNKKLMMMMMGPSGEEKVLRFEKGMEFGEGVRKVE